MKKIMTLEMDDETLDRRIKIYHSLQESGKLSKKAQELVKNIDNAMRIRNELRKMSIFEKRAYMAGEIKSEIKYVRTIISSARKSRDDALDRNEIFEDINDKYQQMLDMIAKFNLEDDAEIMQGIKNIAKDRKLIFN